MISFKHIIKELLAEKTRFFLTLIAIVWATVAIASMLAIGEGLRQTFVRAMNSSGQNIIYVRGGATAEFFHGRGMNQPVQLIQQDLDLIRRAIPEIKTISPQYEFFSKLRYGQQTFSGLMQAVNAQYGVMRNIIAAPGGRFIDPIDVKHYKRVIVLGDHVAAELFKKNENPVGKTLYLLNQPFRVIGVMRPKLQLMDYPDAYMAWIPASTYKILNNPATIDKFIFVPENISANETVKKQIRTVFAYEHHYDPRDESLLQYRDYGDIQNKTRLIFTGMEIFLGIVGALTLVVAGVGIANVMLISVNRATREIGLRMALGARSYQILAHYMLESLFATAIGGTLGLLLTQAAIALIKSIPVHGSFFQIIGKPEPVLSPFVLLLVILILGLTGLFAGLIPARKAANIDPAVALRHP